MNPRLRPLLSVRFWICLAVPSLAVALFGQNAPQDNWTLDRVLKLSSSDPQWGVRLVDADAQGNIILVQSNDAQPHVITFDSTGAFKTQFRFNTNGFNYVFRSTSGKYYVSFWNHIEVYSSLGVFEFRLGTPGTSGTAEGVFGWGAMAVASSDGTIFVADRGNNRIQKFSSAGVFVKAFGEAGTGPGQLTNMSSIGITPDGLVTALCDGRINRFAADGSLVYNASVWNGWGTGPLIMAPDGLMIRANGSSDLSFISASGTYAQLSYNGICGLNRRTGELYSMAGTSLQIWRRGFRTLGANPPKYVPAPAVVGASQRSNGYVDIDYTVNDADSATVTTALVAYRGGTSLIKDMVPLKSDALVEGTAAKLGAGVPTGVVHRVTWNPASATGLSSGDLVFEILARDDRPKLIDIDYITLPTTPALTICRTPLTNADLKTVWAWLLANGESALTRAGDGEIVGPGGAFTSSSGDETKTNILGRAWLFAKLGVREATPEEVQKAKLATSTSGSGNQFATSASQRMGSRPQYVNEWTFDGTGQSSGMMAGSSEMWWVVPLQ